MSFPDEWKRIAEKEPKGDPIALVRKVPEGIEVKPIYTASDLDGIEHLDTLPGMSPFVRGLGDDVYWQTVDNPPVCGILDCRGVKRILSCRPFLRTEGLPVAFDLTTHRGYDSDHPRVLGDVGKAGVAIDSVEHRRSSLKASPLGETSVPTMNGAIIPILATFIVAGEEQGTPREALSGIGLAHTSSRWALLDNMISMNNELAADGAVIVLVSCIIRR